MIKSIFVLLFAAIVVASCGETPKTMSEPKRAAAPVVNADSVSMADAIHTFYKWYGETGKQLITKINFVNRDGPHPSLDRTLLAKYLNEFSRSNAVCLEFIQNETIFYRACGLAWDHERSDKPISCFDVDRYYCQQGGDPNEFLTAGVTSQITADRATVQLMLNPKGPNGGPRDFEMKKENGKWMLSKMLCNEEVAH